MFFIVIRLKENAGQSLIWLLLIIIQNPEVKIANKEEADGTNIIKRIQIYFIDQFMAKLVLNREM